jgi:hypothetical protein
MRVALGLVSLLVVVAIILLLFNFYQAPMLKKGVSAREEARQIAGRDENNAPVTDAILLDSHDRAGRMEGALVKDILAGSTLQNYYGLQKGDVILEVGQVAIKNNISSPDEAKDFLLYAYQRNEPVVVLRGSERLVLPIGAPARNAAAVAPAGPAAPGEAATAPQPGGEHPQQAAQEKPAQKKPGGLEGQLDLIRNRPGGNEAE